jgi:hypothetical protein
LPATAIRAGPAYAAVIGALHRRLYP